MKVFKFGGASVKDAEAFQNVCSILEKNHNGDLFIVLSAMGKTTNMLEGLHREWFNGNAESAMIKLNEIKKFHLDVAESLLTENSSALADLDQQFEKIQTLINSKCSDDFYKSYDAIVSFGEILSSKILWYFLEVKGYKTQWVDARQEIITDNTFKEGKINWETTQTNLHNITAKGGRFLTQGFIGGTSSGEPVTLGREGSDFTAAIIANCLDAEEVTIWKDVPGLMNADPKLRENAEKLSIISYHEAIELAFYGAKVIHPKTIKPLQNKKIPLYIKSFVDHRGEGSVIQPLKTYDQDIPSFIWKTDQVLLSLKSRDFSFIEEDQISRVFSLLSKFNFRVNMMQNSAISFSVVLDLDERKLDDLINELEKDFTVRYNTGIDLLTIRHFSDKAIEEALGNSKVMLEQRSRNTVQFAIKHITNG